MNQLQIIELNGQRVLTTQQIAEGYGAKPRTIVDNFNNNKSRFEEGKHFVLLEGEYLREFKRKNENFGFAQNMNKLYLWTEKGALLHAKSLGTDKAWDMYDVLVDTYFKVQKMGQQLSQPDMSNLSPELQMFNQMFQAVANQEQKLVEVNDKVDNISNIVALNVTDWRKESQKIIRAIGYKIGGGTAYQEISKEIYAEVDRRAGSSLKTRLTNMRRVMAEEGVSKSKRSGLNYLDVIDKDKRLKEIYIAVVKDFAIKYQVEVA